MTSPIYPVFEGDGGLNTPKRPTADVDLGGLDFVDSVKYPPKDRERLSCTDYMQVTMSLERVARMTPVLIVEGSVEGGSASVTSIVSTNDSLTTANVTIAEGSTGVYTITIPAARLPPAIGRPSAESINGAGGVAKIDVPTYSSTSVVMNVRDYAGTLTSAATTYRVLVY